MLDIIRGILDCLGYWQIVIGIITGFIPFLIYILFFIKKERRLFKNLSKKIYIIKVSSEQNATQYIDLINNVGWFNIHQNPIDTSDNISNIYCTDDSSLLVLIYDAQCNKDTYEKIMQLSLDKKIPLICYSESDIKDEDLYTKFRKHPYMDICNSKTRLLTQLFNIAAVTPNEKRKD